MQQSTPADIEKATRLVWDTRAKIDALLKQGKKVHIIWDFDGVLASSRSDDIFALTNFDLARYFEYEERLLFESPEYGLWLLPIAHNPHFPNDRVTQDIVTARSSALAMRVQMFCIAWHLSARWMLFLGHQPKEESCRMILRSLKDDPDYHVFCVDDNPKHVDTFYVVARTEGMENRAYGIVAPVIRTYSQEDLQKHFDSVMGAVGNTPLRVRDPADDTRGFIVLPEGTDQFRRQINLLREEVINKAYHFELRKAFVEVYGEVGEGRFKTEEELEFAMNQFILGIACP